MSLFFIIFFIVYGSANYYIFIRGWQALSQLSFIKPFYIFLFCFSALSYLAAKIINTHLPEWLYEILLWVGSFWFAFMLYFFLFIVLIDFTRLLNYFFSIYPSFITDNYQTAKFITFISVLIVTLLIIIAGHLNTKNIKLNYAEIEIPKKNSQIENLNVVLVADFHLTPINDGNLLKKVLDKINSLNPDIVLMPGDILDDDVERLKSRKIAESFFNIKSRYGIFVSNGNHEFIIGVEEAVKYMRELKMNVLRDSAVLVENSFYILGREDRSKKNFTSQDRKPLKEIVANLNRNYPVIVVDHTPLNLEEMVEEKIELQVSGHTHHGQLFPLNLITSNIVYDVSWGFLRKGYTQFYVTCGIGTWGPPVRIGSDSEIVNIKLKFVEN
jgi:predicted MPP superfamily phosphohydrolase